MGRQTDVSLPAERRSKAMARFAVLRPHLEDDVPLSRAAEAAGVPVRTARRWLVRFRQEGMAGLARAERDDRGGPRLPDELVRMIKGMALARPPPSAAAIHRRLAGLASDRGWPMPATRTVRAVVAGLDPAMRTLAHDGPAAYRDRTLCETLHFTGYRPSELLEITPARVDLSGGTIAIRSLKKRKDASGRQKVVYRAVPVPSDYLDTLDTAHDLRQAQGSRKRAAAPIRPLSSVRVWQIVKRIMIEAGLPDGPQRSPKGLRHGFRVNAAVNGIPLNMLQKWLGHAHLSTTAIYADAAGCEEQDIAGRMWR